MDSLPPLLSGPAVAAGVPVVGGPGTPAGNRPRIPINRYGSPRPLTSRHYPAVSPPRSANLVVGGLLVAGAILIAVVVLGPLVVIAMSMGGAVLLLPRFSLWPVGW